MNRNVSGRLFAFLWEAQSSSVRPLSRSLITNLQPTPIYGHSLRSFSRTSLRHSLIKKPKHAVARSFASGSFLALGAEPATAAIESSPTCMAAVEKALSNNSLKQLDRRKLPSLGPCVWQSDLQQESHGSLVKIGRRYKSSTSAEKHTNKTEDGRTGKDIHEAVSKPENNIPNDGIHPSTGRHLMDRLPAMPHLHRPTKEELLAAATGFWSRLKVHFKWFSIRSVRPFNMDEIGAFFSWFVLGHVIWVIVGTTTFFSLAIFAINTVFAQG
jgi:distribution and morphology protein 31